MERVVSAWANVYRCKLDKPTGDGKRETKWQVTVGLTAGDKSTCKHKFVFRQVHQGPVCKG